MPARFYCYWTNTAAKITANTAMWVVREKAFSLYREL